MHISEGDVLIADRGDITYAVKEVCRSMSNARECDVGKLKRIGKYLNRYPRVVQRFPWWTDEGDTQEVKVFSDSDWAGRRRSRKNTSGGVMLWNGCTLKGWSKTQTNLTLSSAEAELVALGELRRLRSKKYAERLWSRSRSIDMGRYVRGTEHRTQAGSRKAPAHRSGDAMDPAEGGATDAQVPQGLGRGEPSRPIHETLATAED